MSQEMKSWVHGVVSMLTKLEEQPCTSAERSAVCPTPPSASSSPTVTTVPSYSRFGWARNTTSGALPSYQQWRRDCNPLQVPEESEKTVYARIPTGWDESKNTRCIVRVHSNGTILVQWRGTWIDACQTDLTHDQLARIRNRWWGRPLNGTYKRLSDVPRMMVGHRFWIRGEPENDGLWEFSSYFNANGGVRIRRVLPNYHCPRKHRKKE